MNKNGYNMRSVFSLFSSPWPSIWALPTPWCSRTAKALSSTSPRSWPSTTSSGEVVAVGREAQEMLGRTPGTWWPSSPCRTGSSRTSKSPKNADLFHSESAQPARAGASADCYRRSKRDYSGGKRAVQDSAYRARASEVFLVEQAMAAAIGAGLQLKNPPVTWLSTSAAAPRTSPLSP